jgi:hypothetical protein
MKSLAAVNVIIVCAFLSLSSGTVLAQGSCNLPLPCQDSTSSDLTAFTIANDGGGRAGIFLINDPLNDRPALEGRTTSTANNAFGVLGRVFTSEPGTNSAGVRGLNNEPTGGSVRMGVWGTANAPGGLGVLGTSTEGVGVSGTSDNGTGVTARSETGIALFAETTDPNGGIGVWGRSNTRAVVGTQGVTSCAGTYAVGACATTGIGVLGRGTQRGIVGTQGLSNSCPGIYAVGACATTGDGLVARAGTGTAGNGVTATADTGRAVFGNSASGIGVIGNSTTRAVIGTLGGTSCAPPAGATAYAVGGCGASLGDGVVGKSVTGRAGYFEGNVVITGSLVKGSGAFKIDHPQDPKNKYLSHSFVESPDMLGLYAGNVVLDAQGAATVVLPDWFEALNRDFRYQLTAIGAPAPSLYIAEEISQHRFKIAGGQPGMKVSWQVMGTRHDAFAEKNRIPVEEWKSAAERGKYLHPAAYGQPEEMGVHYVQDPEPNTGQLSQGDPEPASGLVAQQRSR